MGTARASETKKATIPGILLLRIKNKKAPENQSETFYFSHSRKNCGFFTQKEHPDPQKLKFCMKKMSFFTQKNHPASQKTQVVH